MISSILLSALRKAMGFRCDGQPQLTYYQASDYGVHAEPFSFPSGKWTLRGAKYSVGQGSFKGLLVFHHGIGAGSTAYMQEICAFAKRGYLVYAYDNTGCMTSEGQGIGCLAQSLLDQEAFFSFLEKDEDQKGLKRYVAGHSWGGYTAFGAMNDAYRVEKVVSLSGFVSLPKMLIASEPKLAKFEDLLRRALKKGYGPKAGEDMAALIAKSKARLLYVQGEADPLVTKAENYDILEKLFGTNERVKLLLVPGAMHNPYWTLEAQKYLYNIQKKKMFERGFDNSFVIDYGRLNHDDPAIMDQIFSFLEE